MDIPSNRKSAPDYFPTEMPSHVSPAVEIDRKTLNHARLELGSIEYDFSKGLKKGDTGAMFGDAFCLVHGITRVFVLDPNNHVVALVTPMRYMMYMAHQMYATEKYEGNIFTFAQKARAPRWSMRAAAAQILEGQYGNITKEGALLTLSGVSMDDKGNPHKVQPVFQRVPFVNMSWYVMDRWLQQANSHSVSFVVADTNLSVHHDHNAVLPLCVRENESDLIMADVVTGIEDQRYENCSSFDKETHAFQFRGGWYAPKTLSGLTRIQRVVYVDAKDGKWKYKDTYSSKFVDQPHDELWYIGGITNVDQEAQAINVGDHREFTGIDSSTFSGGLQSTKMYNGK